MLTSSNSHTNTDDAINGDGKNSTVAAVHISSEFEKFLADIEDLVKATNLLTGEELAKAKVELANRIESAKAKITTAGYSVAQKAKNTAAITNDYAHNQPWQMIGAGSVIGFALGYLIARRNN